MDRSLQVLYHAPARLSACHLELTFQKSAHRLIVLLFGRVIGPVSQDGQPVLDTSCDCSIILRAGSDPRDFGNEALSDQIGSLDIIGRAGASSSPSTPTENSEYS